MAPFATQPLRFPGTSITILRRYGIRGMVEVRYIVRIRVEALLETHYLLSGRTVLDRILIYMTSIKVVGLKRLRIDVWKGYSTSTSNIPTRVPDAVKTPGSHLRYAKGWKCRMTFWLAAIREVILIRTESARS